MTVHSFRKLEGMEMEFVSGQLEEYPRERAIGYTMTFKLVLDFTHFKQAANVWIPGYLEGPKNAIRPDLGWLAYHNHYSPFGSAAGDIVDNKKLFELFTDQESYLEGWVSEEMERRFHRPVFKVEGDVLFITARHDFRWGDPARQIKIQDLGIIPFHWALTLIELVDENLWPVSILPKVAPVSTVSKDFVPISIVTLMYTQTETVFIEGVEVLRGARYVNGKTLSFGPITGKQVLTAG